MSTADDLHSLLSRAKDFAMMARTDLLQDSPEQVLVDAVSEIEKLKKKNAELVIENQTMLARIKRIEDVIWNVK